MTVKAPLVVMGLDLSLTGPAAVVIPAGWVPGNWAGLWSGLCKTTLNDVRSERDKLERLATISHFVCSTAKRFGVTRVTIEGYAFDKTNKAHALGELGGVVRLDLLREVHLVATAVPPTKARAYFVGGPMPRKGQKAFVLDLVRSAGAAFGSDDEADAFVVANWALSEAGLPGLCCGGVNR